ncbi:NAD(P)-binding protein [Eremomyces bilateralis CBS 781.70]|uniref:NAD(P)-binding protein n=1 Tax=Eremomyces bilateralis CBS 781.70 TaxID=1392243 RepID=A0A6G1GGS6_9PEZI|nr:NAD(P)-binding protein [Eremomyces bilateralis CBS 781.70]KAF1817070.1 NAD(P)-binding protein [Eremomyces bilateralis CBS 781.70]
MDLARSTGSDALFSAKGLVIVITGGGTEFLSTSIHTRSLSYRCSDLYGRAHPYPSSPFPGIGLAFAKSLLNAQAKKVYILGRRLSVLQASAAFIDPSAAVVTAIQCSVTDQASVAAAAAQIEREVGFVDVLINNAGISGPEHRSAYAATDIKQVSEILSGSWEKWEGTFATNTASVVGVSAAFLPLLEKGNERRGWKSGKLEAGGKGRERDVEVARRNGFEEGDLRLSQILTVASIAGLMRNVAHGLAYCASKAGAIHLGKILASMLAPWGIRSNVIAPGVFPSEMTEGAKLRWSFNEIPANRQGVFEEMAGLILHLVGQSGGYKNGAVEVIDGGRLSVYPASY